MPRSRHLILTFSLLFSLALASPGLSRGDGGNYGGGDGGGEGEGAGLQLATTKKVVKIILDGIERCQPIPQNYRFDCYRQTYRQAVKFLNGRPMYGDARKALVAVEQALKDIVTQNADPNLPPMRKGFQKFRPIKQAAVPRAKAEFSRALDQAETVLLRAPARTGVHYVRIAEAVNSNKVLLRSRLYPDMDDLFQTAFA